jgi:hypothetical protein
MTVALSAFYDDVLPHLPSLPPGAAIDLLLRDAAITYCRRSRAIDRDLTPIDIVSGTATYAFSLGAPPAGTEVVHVLRCAVDGVVLDPATQESLDDWRETWRDESGQAVAYLRPDEASIQIVLTPDTGITGGLELRVALAPTRSATAVDDRLLADDIHRRAIVAGTLARAMLTPRKPYSNGELGVRHEREFNRLCLVGNVTATRGRTGAPLRTTACHTVK